MSDVDPAATTATRLRRRGGLARAFLAALRTGRGRTGAGLVIVMLAIALLGPLVPFTDPTAFVGPPFAKVGAPLGTDVLGRDVLARVLHGGLMLLVASLVATVLALVVGASVGVIAAYREGWIDLLLMRSADVLLVIPQLVLALLLVSIDSTSTTLVVIAVAISQAPQIARVVHASAQDVCERDYVQAVALWGVPPRRVIFGHVLPALVTPLSVEAGFRFSFSIILIASMNFLGFGITPPAPSWGVMVGENRIGLGINPWGVLAPGILLALLAVGTSMFTDALARASLGGDYTELAELKAVLPQEPSK